MSATFVSLFILATSAVMLAFWLRSACRAVLRERFEEDYSAHLAEDNRLAYLEVRRILTERPRAAEFDALLSELEADYLALTYLLRNAATVHVGSYTRSERLLILDFQLLRLWVRVTRFLGTEAWRSGFQEMVNILEYFGNVVGQRLVLFPIQASAE